MNPYLIAASILVFFFSFVLIFGAPFLPTKKRQIEAAFELLKLKKGETILDLGSGDGRVLRYAAKNGYKGVGYELNPLLYLLSLLVTFRYRKDVKIYCKNFWVAEFPENSAIFIFLLDRFMDKLHKKIIHKQNTKKVKVVSFAFKFEGIKPIRTSEGVYLYEL